MRDTRKLNTIAMTEFNELVGIVGSKDQMMVVYLGQNSSDNFNKWYSRIGLFYDPDIKLYLARDHLRDGLSLEHEIKDKTYDIENIYFAFRQLDSRLETLERLFNGKTRNKPVCPALAKSHVMEMRRVIDHVLGDYTIKSS